MTIKITTANGGSDSLDFGCAQTAIVATVTGTEVSSGEGKLEFKTTTGGTSATKATVLANGNVGIGTTAPLAKNHTLGAGTAVVASGSDGAQEAIIEGANIALTSSFGNLNVISNTAQAANTGGQIAFGGKSTDSDNKYATWSVIKGAKENGTSANIASYLAFSTRANGAGNTEKLRITSDGRGLSSFTAKAWVNMNGTGTPAITDSHNISSITDNATGEYRVVLANNLSANDSGAPVVSAMSGTAVGNDGRAASCSLNNSTGITVSVGSVTDFSGREDVDTISVILFGD